jgi:surfeit locus 1 family protein
MHNRASEDDLEKNSYRMVTLSGHFDHSKELIVGLRTSPAHKRQSVATGGQTAAGIQGYFVITPFVTDDGVVLWVNRGWVPQERKEQQSRQKPLPAGRTTITGVLRENENPTLYVNDGKPHVKDNWWLVMDAQAFTTAFGAALKLASGQMPALFEQVADSSHLSSDDAPLRSDMMLKKPRDFVDNAFYITPEKHIGYLTTWYGLCVAIAAAALQLRRRNMRMLARMQRNTA